MELYLPGMCKHLKSKLSLNEMTGNRKRAGIWWISFKSVDRAYRESVNMKKRRLATMSSKALAMTKTAIVSSRFAHAFSRIGGHALEWALIGISVSPRSPTMHPPAPMELASTKMIIGLVLNS